MSAKRISFLAFVLIFGLALIANNYAQEKKTVDIKAKKMEKTRGENSKIKVDRPAKDKPVPKPEKTRGEYCGIAFSNNTGYYVDVYVDGYYKGTLAPWEDGKVIVYSGYTSIYCKTTGGTYEWSDAGNCDGVYTFKLSL
jgi:hypothetical protein